VLTQPLPAAAAASEGIGKAATLSFSIIWQLSVLDNLIIAMAV